MALPLPCKSRDATGMEKKKDLLEKGYHRAALSVWRQLNTLGIPHWDLNFFCLPPSWALSKITFLLISHSHWTHHRGRYISVVLLRYPRFPDRMLTVVHSSLFVRFGVARLTRQFVAFTYKLAVRLQSWLLTDQRPHWDRTIMLQLRS